MRRHRKKNRKNTKGEHMSIRLTRTSLKVVVVGVAYLVLHFIPGVQAPTNMQQSAFEESMGFSTRLADNHPMMPNHGLGGGGMSGATPSTDPEAYPQKTYVSDGPTI